MGKSIYIAEDDVDIRALIDLFLNNEGYAVRAFATGDALLGAFLAQPADMVILDIMLPGTDGLTLCARLRQRSNVPIIIVSARDSEADRIAGITLGSDDYLTKPFSPMELTARVKALFRRLELDRGTPAKDSLLLNNLSLDPAARIAVVDSAPLDLTPTEFLLLAYLLRQGDRAVSREELLKNVWKYDFEVDTRATDDVMKRLRKKLLQAGAQIRIETVWGFGFRIVAEGTRMKSLQAHIRNPFLILIVALLIAIMLLLNVAIRLYLNNGVKQELRDAKAVLSQIAAQQNETEPTLPLLQKLDRSLTFARLQDDIHILLYQKNGRLLYPAAYELPDLPRTLNDISAARLSAMREDRVYSFFRASGRYFALPWRLSSGGTLLLVTPAVSVNRIVRTVDTFLLIVLALGIFASFIAANAAARRIARPVTQLSERMRAVGEGRFSEGATAAARANIREIDSLQESAAHMAARLAAYDGAQKAFLANASHELKTPLMSIQGYAEGIEGGVVPDAKQAAQVVVRESKRLSALVSELLTLSRMDTALGRELQPMNLNQILPEYEQRLLGAAAKQQRRLMLRLPENGPVISGDDELLYQAVMNIVSNCLRYANAEVVISLSDNANEAILRISDDGDGIPEADLPHLFERFYKGKNGNFGLGLAIASSAVAALGGHIAAGNDGGAVFTISLPLYQG